MQYINSLKNEGSFNCKIFLIVFIIGFLFSSMFNHVRKACLVNLRYQLIYKLTAVNCSLTLCSIIQAIKKVIMSCFNTATILHFTTVSPSH